MNRNLSNEERPAEIHLETHAPNTKDERSMKLPQI